MVSVRFSRGLGWWLPVVAVASLCVLSSTNASAQAVAEAAGATSVSAGVAAGAKPPVVIPKFPAAASGTQHLIASAGPPPQETNVREFQAQAGKDAGKMVKEAMPDGGGVGIFVGLPDPINAKQRRQGVLDELAGEKDAKGK